MIPKKYNEVLKIMQTLLYTASYSPNLFSPSIAYTYARTGSTCGDIFKIFVNDADSELKNFLFLHECGHIIFAHSRNNELRFNKFLNAKIKSAYKKLAKLFPSERNFSRMFESLLLNVVMDFEVNSRLFDHEEWDFMQLHVQNLLKDKTTKGFWPEDYGYPCGLCWNEYLNLILLNPEEFFIKHRFFMQTKKQLFNESFDGVLTQEEYEKFKEENKKNPLSQEEIDTLQKEAMEHECATFGIPTGQDGCSKLNSNPVTIKFKDFSPKVELLKEIQKLLQIKTKKCQRRDMLYNSNRRKTNTNVIIPKNVADQKIEKARLYILMDVSGSVDAKLVHDFISTFKKVSNFFKHTRIITWSTHLIDDFSISENFQNHYGGGTNISTGIDYVGETYNPKPTDVLFVISDFLDTMKDWEKSLLKLNCKKYAINWKPNIQKNFLNPGFIKIIDFESEIN